MLTRWGSNENNTMPQLDAATYLSQITWLTIFFVTYYRVGLNFILPALSGRLKTRAKKAALAKGRVSGFDGERQTALSGYDTTVSSSCGWVTRSLVSAVAQGDAWRSAQVRTVDAGALRAGNVEYLNAVSTARAQGVLVKNIDTTQG